MKPLPAFFEPHQHSYAETSVYIEGLLARINQLEQEVDRLAARVEETAQQRDQWHGAWHLKWSPGT